MVLTHETGDFKLRLICLGFNVPLVINPSNKKCEAPACSQNVNAYCPPLLRTGLDQSGQSLACLHPCNAGFGQEKFGNRACCSGGYNDPELCAICGVDYYSLFKDLCRTSYAVSPLRYGDARDLC